MGITTTKADRLPFNINDYKQVVVDGNQNYHVFRNLHTGIEMEEYILQFNDYSQFQEYEEGFNWRLNEDYIVNTIHFIHNNQKEFCSTVYGAFLYTQRIPLRLSDIQDIPYPDNLHVLFSCFEGFGLLYPKTNYFEIRENFIGFNFQAITKVWINSDFSKNYPDMIGDINEKKDECDMVQKIIQIVNATTDHSSEPSSLFDFFMEHNRLTFAEARLLLKQFAKQHKIKIPQTFESIQGYLQGDIQQEKFQSNKKASSHLIMRKSSTQKMHNNLNAVQNFAKNHKNIRTSTKNKHLNKIYNDNNQLIIIDDKNVSNYKKQENQHQLQRVNKINNNYEEQQGKYNHANYSVDSDNIITFPSHRQQEHYYYPQTQQKHAISMQVEKPKVIFNYLSPQTFNNQYYSRSVLNQTQPFRYFQNYNNQRPINQFNQVHQIINNPYRYNNSNYFNFTSPSNNYLSKNQIPCDIIYQQPQQSYQETEQYQKQNKILIPGSQQQKNNNSKNNYERTQLHSSEIVTKKRNHRLNQSSSQKDILNQYPNIKFPQYNQSNHEFHQVKMKKQNIIRSAKEMLLNKAHYYTHSPDTTIINNNKSHNQILYHLSEDYDQLDPQIAADLMMMTL